MIAAAAEYEPALVEAAVLEATRRGPDAERLRRERDPIYEIADPEAREQAFRRLAADWFRHLGLGAPLRRALDELPRIVAACDRAVVAGAVARRDESADLLVSAPARPTLLVRVRGETLAHVDQALPLLRRELLHVADMLDPAFGYTPALPEPVAGGPRERAVREAYRVLWDAYVDGRLARQGRLPPGARGERLRAFRAAFPWLGERATASFARFFEGATLTHAELLAFAANGDAAAPAPRCGLCRLPSRDLAPGPAALPAGVRAAIARDAPAWRPEDGLCCRCAEIYAARERRPERCAIP